MPREILTIVQKRQAIERGLSAYLQGTTLQQALNDWEVKYGNQPSFVLNHFLNEICVTKELRHARKAMLKQVLAEMAELEKQILLHPNIKQNQTLVDQEQLLEACSLFLWGVWSTVNLEDRDAFDAELNTLVSGFRLHTLHQVHEVRLMLMRLSVKQYDDILMKCYQIYCEFYGPVKADQVYASLKRQVKVQCPTVDMQRLI